jgi:hypothetical protein
VDVQVQLARLLANCPLRALDLSGNQLVRRLALPPARRWRLRLAAAALAPPRRRRPPVNPAAAAARRATSSWRRWWSSRCW